MNTKKEKIKMMMSRYKECTSETETKILNYEIMDEIASITSETIYKDEILDRQRELEKKQIEADRILNPDNYIKEIRTPYTIFKKNYSPHGWVCQKCGKFIRPGFDNVDFTTLKERLQTHNCEGVKLKAYKCSKDDPNDYMDMFDAR